MTQSMRATKPPTKLRPLAVGTFAILTLTASSHLRSPTILLWNASASVPIGLYLVIPSEVPANGDLAVSQLPQATAVLADERRYLPTDVLLIKPVAASSGATVCRFGRHIFVDGRWLATAKERDSRGRLMQVWEGCHTLSPSQTFLMNPAVPDSFDGRYFGPIPLALTKGRAKPLLTFGPPSAR